VDREGLVVEILAEEIAFRQRQLGAHQQRQNPRQQEEQEGGAEIGETDGDVVDVADLAPARRNGPDALQLLFFPGRAWGAVREGLLHCNASR
jgi:hypothetical protein